MNDEAREILTAAALSGHKQVFGTAHGTEGGECAWGVLHLAMHDGNRLEALRCYYWRPENDGPAKSEKCIDKLEQRFDVDHAGVAVACETHPNAWDFLCHRNDVHHEDFLTISRKAP